MRRVFGHERAPHDGAPASGLVETKMLARRGQTGVRNQGPWKRETSMGSHTAGPSPPPTPSPGRHSGAPWLAFTVHRSWKVALAVAVIMVVLAVLGVALTTTNRAVAPTYWIALVPVYGLLCIITAWIRTKRDEGGPRLVVHQVFHWLGVAGALGLDFLIRGTGEETGVAAGFTALLLLALGCFLAGVHLEWLFALVGLLLSLTLVVVVKADQYLWLVAIVLVLAVVGMIALMRMFAKAHDRKERAGQTVPAAS